jgi:putative ABC transport system ATP-binding protein
MMLGALMKPSEGSISIDGQEISRLAERKLPDVRLRQFGFIFQDFNLLSALNVQDNVAIAAAKTLETSWTDCPELPADAEPDREADREIADRIRDLAGRIPSPKQRTAVQRRYGLDGRDPETFRQIGDTLGVDPRAIKWRVRAGTDWIRKQCQEEWI